MSDFSHLPAFLLALTDIGDFFYAVPLIVSMSLVYSATRFEDTPRILGHAARFAVWVVGFMFIVFAVLWLIGRSL